MYINSQGIYILFRKYSECRFSNFQREVMHHNIMTIRYLSHLLCLDPKYVDYYEYNVYVIGEKKTKT